MAFLKRFLAARGSFQAAVLVTLNTSALAGLVPLDEDVILAIDACIGAWLFWASDITKMDDLKALASAPSPYEDL